ncbi:MAG: cation-transporting P-type ATPase, partial [Pseudomonadota bacterium]
ADDRHGSARMADEPWNATDVIGHQSDLRQNIGISLATKALFVGLTALGMASMWGAIAADVGVSLLVVANALRLLNGHRAGVQPVSDTSIAGQPANGAAATGH